MKRGFKKEFSKVTPHLGRVSYGAAELRRVYTKNMTLAFFFSTAITFCLLNLLWLLVDQESFNPSSQRVVRIFKYSEIELPRSFSDVEFGLSAYPISDEQVASAQTDQSVPVSPLIKKPISSSRTIPRERGSGKDLNDLPGPSGGDKLQTDDKTVRQNIFGNERASEDRDDVAGGSGESSSPLRKGGVPVPGNAGEPPSGVDLSGIGSSSKPSAGTTAYGLGNGGEGGDENGGGFSMRWLHGITRQKRSGELPVYPANTKISAQVKILATVLPDGTVRSVQPVQKADRALEDAAMKAIRLWKFEPLGISMPQVEQSCVVTFYFKLK